MQVAVEFDPRSARQPVSLSLLTVCLLLLLLSGVGVAVVAAWSLVNPPIGVPSNAAWPTARALPPRVEPTALVQIDRDQARAANAAVPFSTGSIVPAIGFSGMMGADRERAITCLAAAAYYEAGNDLSGMTSVVQVVLNRVRHPAFPASICGVVFQGSERRTGCQFTFTCDGALNRPAVPAIWAKARLAAIQGLSGFVDRRVGLATHYHTDWVLPYWNPKMTKIAQVGTHLFFRWPGPWGELGAFQQRYRGDPVIDGRIAAMAAGEPAAAEVENSPATSATPVLLTTGVPAIPAPALSAEDLGASAIRGYDSGEANFLLQLDPNAFPGSYALLAYKLCKDRTPCRVTGWRDPSFVPTGHAVTEAARKRVSFSYQRLGPGSETALWNCQEMPRGNAKQCLPGT